MKIAVCFGTRPEIIKLYLLSRKMSSSFSVINVFTGQHHSLYNDVSNLIPDIHYFLPTGEYEHVSLLYADLMKNLYNCFSKERPDLVVVQGDTASSYCAALCAFLMGIKIGHVEAGLRTYDMASPFPEEFNRQSISKISNYNWCPTITAFNNILRENSCIPLSFTDVPILTGNTIVDAVNDMTKDVEYVPNNKIIITLHRRENKDKFSNMIQQINRLAKENPQLEFVFPAHPNPIIQSVLPLLKEENVHVVTPIPYQQFIGEIKNCKAIITDSGGIQEEAICLKKKVLICRDNTERMEGVKIGMCKLVGDDVLGNFEWLLQSDNLSYENPYGDGNSCDKIIKSIKTGD